MTNLSTRILFNSRMKESKEQNALDFYPTPAWSTELMLANVEVPTGSNILEPCNGLGSISDVLKFRGHSVYTIDISSEALADEHIDFLSWNPIRKFDAVITNPPYKFDKHNEFERKALDCTEDGGVVIFLGQITKLEGLGRKRFYDEFPLYKVLVHSKRLCINGKTGIGYAWFIWKKGFNGPCELKII